MSNIDSWTTTNGIYFTQLSYDGLTLCGVDDKGQIHCATDGLLNDTPAWFDVPLNATLNTAPFVQVETWNGLLLAIDSGKKLYTGIVNREKPYWRQLSAVLEHVSTDGSNICGVNLGTLYCASDKILSPVPGWRTIQMPDEKLAKYVTVRNGSYWAIDETDRIILGNPTSNVAGTVVDGRLKNIDSDGTITCGENAQQEIWCHNQGPVANVNWMPQKPVQGAQQMLHSLALAGGRMFVTDTKGHTYTKVATFETKV